VKVGIILGEVSALDTSNTANTDLTRTNRIIISILAILGILVSGALIVVYYNANFNPLAGPSFCAISDKIDCDAVAETVFSRFLEVPLALWGLGFYLAVLFTTLFPFEKFGLFKDVKHPKAFIFNMSIFSILLSIILYFITSYIIEKVCLLCHVLYLLNVGLFFAAKAGTPFEDLFINAFADLKTMFSDSKWQKIFGGLALTAVVALVLINIYKPFTPGITETAETTTAPEAAAPQQQAAGGGQPYKIGEIGNILGERDAKLIIHEYTDFECPYCAMSNESMLKLAKEVPGIKIQHHDFPLDSECNPYIKNYIHPTSCLASYYAKAARKQGKFWDMAVLLYANRENLDENKILELAKTINLDPDKLKKDVTDNKEIFKGEILQDIEKAKKLGINGTPTIVIGIKKHEGAMPYPELKQMVQDSLQ
jgi:protein-disulfide isomerase/uncharacterized membrane protein